MLGIDMDLADLVKFLENTWWLFGIILYYINNRISKFRNKYKHEGQVEHDIKNLSLIYERLIKYRIDFNASRITITQFHNGEKYYSNNSILKMSITHESDDDGVSRVFNDYQNILVSRYNKFIEILLKEEIVQYKKISELPSTYQDDMLLDLKLRGTENFYSIKLLSKSGNIIGFLSLCFIGDEELDIDKFKEFGNIIGFSLRS